MNLQTIETKNKALKYVKEYLLIKASTDVYLKQAIEKCPDTDLKGCFKYVSSNAQKEAVENAAMIDNKIVEQWCVEYFIDYENIQAKKETKKSAPVYTQVKANEREMKEKLDEMEYDPLEDIAISSEKKPSVKKPSNAKKPSVEKPKASKKVMEDKKPSVKKPKAKNQDLELNKAFEQISIDFFLED